MRPSFKCDKEDPCSRCGACCHIREDKFLTEEEDHHLRNVTYHETGVIYIYPMHTYTISLTHEEKETILKNSITLKIPLKILPKKMMIVDGKIAVIDWFLDHDVCPLHHNDENKCLVYMDRPHICRLFPTSHNTNIYEDIKKYDDGKRMDFDEAVSICKKFAGAL